MGFIPFWQNTVQVYIVDLNWEFLPRRNEKKNVKLRTYKSNSEYNESENHNNLIKTQATNKRGKCSIFTL